MPTKKKRVGFIPRDDVMRIIDKLSIENNLSSALDCHKCCTIFMISQLNTNDSTNNLTFRSPWISFLLLKKSTFTRSQ